MRCNHWCNARRKLPGQKTALRNGLVSGDLAAFPNNSNWCFSKYVVKGCWHEVSNTCLFDILDSIDGAMPHMTRKHRFWKPSSLLRSALFSQVAESPYKSLLKTAAWKISFLRCLLREVCRHKRWSTRKSAFAAPSLRANSLDIRPSLQITVPR